MVEAQSLISGSKTTPNTDLEDTLILPYFEVDSPGIQKYTRAWKWVNIM